MIDRERPNFVDSANEHSIQPLSPGEEQPSPWYGESVSTSSQTSLFGSDLTATTVQTTDTIYEPTSLTSSITNVLATATTVIPSISSSTGTSPQPGDSSSGSSNTKTIAIAVPVSVVGAALLLGALFLLLRRRRRKTRQENPSDLQVDMAQATRTNLLPQNGTPWNVGHARSHEILFDGPYPSQTASNDHIPIRPAQSSNHQINTTPRSQPPTLSIPTPPAGVTEHRQPEGGLGLPETSPVTAGWRAGSEDRPRSPFDHPLDDAMSEVSGLSDRRGATHSRDLDDISSVSSIGDDEPATRR
ncbi:uncharacterized protein NFIA_008660 [Aspergillus fischeri NRRL 181]|uniref:Uncharacterized protein n=1 Tax=Neosartorya fischeri (strain ATCC 1020 / DSM 3700 / CBS 544.65 / FGSC A1164 / JCM 1740 / NRRL 181 / WB 181) TaxID=331117 RepID=A1D196_NEOFI|nr:uncharacterized protein NFIA_008660 [Aspergillus fischeri NRRL 181]EAW22189.1 hypothetical protein NFIA_008660 [Aspergillus fischeri NRRL 181]KAG2010756.1 hypothetical protein GB937_007522 [Aspergillus fischeri]